MPLKFKNIFITGGTGGIGSKLVTMLENSGSSVTCYNREEQGDLCQNIDKICQQLSDNTPDILINMAGYNILDFCENQDIENIIGLNMIAPIRLTQAVLPAMRERNSGQIVNIGSMTALIPLPHLSGYVAAKAGLKGFNDSLRRELQTTNIKITHVIPRAVRTNMNNGVKKTVNELNKVNYDTPETVAKIIYDAIIKQKPEVRIGWPERFYAFMQATFPSIIDKGLLKATKIGEKELLKENNNINNTAHS